MLGEEREFTTLSALTVKCNNTTHTAHIVITLSKVS